jgi:hypothetical protein
LKKKIREKNNVIPHQPKGKDADKNSEPYLWETVVFLDILFLVTQVARLAEVADKRKELIMQKMGMGGSASEVGMASVEKNARRRGK